MANLVKKFCVMLWKCYTVRKHHWIMTLVEILVPILLFILIVLANNEIHHSKREYEARIHDSISEHDIFNSFKYASNAGMYLFYTPQNNFTKRLMELVSLKLNQTRVIGLDNEAQVENEYTSIHKAESHNNIFGIIFKKESDNKIPKSLNYKIRSTKTVDTDLFNSPRNMYSAETYVSNGFIALQMALDKSYIEIVGLKEVKTRISLQKFPDPTSAKDDVKDVLMDFLVLSVVLSFIVLCVSVLKRVVEERRSGVKELMKLMGLKTWMLWFGWLANALLMCIASVTIIVILLKIQFKPGVDGLLLCNAGILWILLILYCTASIFMLFAISAVIPRPNHAMTCGLILWIASYLIGFILWSLRNKYCLGLKLLSCLLPNVGMNWGIRIISEFELHGNGFKWQDFFTPIKGLPQDICMAHVWLMFLIDICVYGLITLYMEAIMPGKYGIAKPWYFPFHALFQKFLKTESIFYETPIKHNYETAPVNLTPGISIQGLRKEFQPFLSKTKKIAVDGISFDIYKDQITALLGHNGAGKTTTMMILTGMFSPTSGNVYINGYSIRDNMSEVRESLGLCPQHNLFFIDLTVKQHFLFFGMLKGSSMDCAQEEADELIHALGLTGHEHKFPNTLSGGMQRKLCLGIALVGNSKVVILDEPTSGLDPEGRRKVWDLLLRMRGHRTILITTHLMEEADVLGDYIAIMDHGQIQCYGTSMYLKKLYGSGYQLSVLKTQSASVEDITNTIRDYVPRATVKSEMLTLISYSLPADNSSLFPSLFSTLEKSKSRLGIDGIGISITTLEEVFLRVGFIAKQEDKTDGSESMDELVEFGDSLEDITGGKVVGLTLLIQQLKALFHKNFVFTLRHWLSFSLQAATQIAIIILLLLLSLHKSTTTEPEPLSLVLNKYGKTKVLYSVEDGVPETLIDFYKEEIKSTGSSLKAIPHSTGIVSALLKENLDFLSDLVVAGEFNLTSKSANALYFDLALHSPPISLNLISNALLKDTVNSDEYSITAANHPFPHEGGGYSGAETVAIYWLFILPLALTIWLGMFIMLPLTERVSACKHLQMMAGVSPYLYWFTTFVWDLILHLAVVLLIIITVAVVDTNHIFSGLKEIGVLSLLLVMYGIGGIPFCFMISYWKNTVGGAFTVLVALIVAGLILPLIVPILKGFAYIVTADIVQHIMLLIPHLAFTNAVYSFSRQVVMNNNCRFMSESIKRDLCFPQKKDPCCYCADDYCEELRQPYLVVESDNFPNGILTHLMFLGVASVLYFAIILLIDIGVLQRIFKAVLSTVNNKIEQQCLDSDVLTEEMRVRKVSKSGHLSSSSSDLLVVSNLKKNYIRSQTAVKGLNFGVLRGECFGLLGVNGAGKTTTFKMLTGDIMPTYGDAFIDATSLSSNKQKFLVNIGYCPQSDSLIECFTGWELLQLFSRLRGVREQKIPAEIQRWITLLELCEYQYSKCGTYSGGNKRKLNTAMALVGSPALIFLDEPTSGVDPVARRSMWNALAKIQTAGQSIVLTSHSMEECEALCTRLAIMVKGQFMCIGSTQHLKQKFAQGFSIRIQLTSRKYSEQKVTTIKQVMKSTFTCILKDEHQVLLHYHVTDPYTSWSYMFTSMEQLKQQHDAVEDYTISETTLEQVFLSFAKEE